MTRQPALRPWACVHTSLLTCEAWLPTLIVGMLVLSILPQYVHPDEEGEEVWARQSLGKGKGRWVQLASGSNLGDPLGEG